MERACVLAAVLLCAAPARAGDRATWVEWLDSVREERKAEAMEALAKEGPDAFDDVAKQLKSKNKPTRRRAMKLLAGYAQQMDDIDEHRKVFLDALEDEDPQISGPALESLKRAGPKTVPKLFSLAGGKDEALAELARTALVAGGERAAPYLQRKLASKSRQTVLDALDLLTEIGAAGAPAYPAAVELTASPMSDVRAAAYRAAAAIGPDRGKSLAVVLKGLEDADDEVVCEAAGALVSLAPESATALVPLLEMPPSLNRDRAVYALSLMAAPAKPVLLKLLDSKSEAARADALRLLVGALEGGEIPARARAILATGGPRERITAARLLALRSTARQDLEIIMFGLLEDKSKEVGDWAWYRIWWERPDEIPAREPVEPHVVARTGWTSGKRLEELVQLARSDDPAKALAGLEALRIAHEYYVPGSPHERAARVAGLSDDVRKSCSRALERLAQWQGADGLWLPGARGCEIGVTALALLAFNAAGYTDASGPYAKTVGKAIRALLKTQGKDGFFGSPQPHDSMIQHQMATAALLDAYVTGSCPSERDACSRALQRMFDLRHKGEGWGYRPTQDKPDLYHTTWGAYATRLGALAKLTGERYYRWPLLNCVYRMADPEFGQIGYDEPGGSPSRPQGLRDAFPPEKSQSMTAAGLWLRYLMYDDMKRDATADLGLRLLADVPPKWDPKSGRIDFAYWHFGANALAMTELSGALASRARRERIDWRKSLETALLAGQMEHGGWDKVDPWSDAGGETYATATCVLALLAPAQFSEDFFPEHRGKLFGVHEDVRDALEKAKRSKDPRIAFAACAALRAGAR